MTTTTTRRATPQQPWPSRREREGGHRFRPAETRHTAPPHVDPDLTARLPVVPWQRSGEPVAAPRPAGLPARPGPASAPARVPAPVVAPAALVHVPRPAPRPVPVAEQNRPAYPSAPAGPRPPRPTVGSGLGRGVADTGPGHRVDGRVRQPRDGLCLAALCLGLVGLPFALTPVTAFLAAGLGILALTYGIAGWSRTRSGRGTTSGSAVTGAVLGLLAVVLGIAGMIAFFQAPDRVVYDVDALTTSVVTSPVGE